MEARGAFLQEEKQLLTVCPAVTVASLLRCFRGTPESSRCRRGGRRAVTGPSEGRVPSHRGGSSAPGNIPPLHRRSRSPEHNCSLGWMLPGTLPYTPEWTRRGCTVGRARTCPAVGGQPARAPRGTEPCPGGPTPGKGGLVDQPPKLLVIDERGPLPVRPEEAGWCWGWRYRGSRSGRSRPRREGRAVLATLSTVTVPGDQNLTGGVRADQRGGGRALATGPPALPEGGIQTASR